MKADEAPEYVAVVVDTYRRAVDSYLVNKNDFVVDLVEKKELDKFSIVILLRHI